MSHDKYLRCSFCGKSKDSVRKFISGPSVYICNECIALCNAILGEDEEREVAEMKSYTDLVNDARSRVPEVTVDDLRTMQERGTPVVVVDVRDQSEANLGMIPGAVHISRGTLEGKIERAVSRDAKVVLYCSSGNRSLLAGDVLREMGYRDVSSLAGGIRAWVEGGGDLDG